MFLMRRLMRALFYLLYHPFAGSYDLVAAAVSLGHWTDWVRSVLPFLTGPRLLELGFGPGHLQLSLRDRAYAVFGLDESRQMVALTRSRLRLGASQRLNLARGLTAHLPFAPRSFDTIVATFPAEFIFEMQTLGEIRRALKPSGRLVVLPMAWHSGKRLLSRLMAWVFRLTGETPGPFERTSQHLAGRLEAAGYSVVVHRLEMRTATLLVLEAQIPP
jgi:ubiquinone/menaquinone biosynthesis C-methylase UbiE